MSLRQRHGRFDAWIKIDGKRAEEFGSGIHGRTVKCLTVRLLTLSRYFKQEVSIFVQEFPSTTSASARADVFIDGIHVGKSVLSPSKRPCCFAGSWIDDESLRPFIFSLAKKNDRQCLSEDAGKIEIRISEIIVLYGVDEDEDIYIRPEPMQEWEPPSVVEQDEEMECHTVVLANFTKEKKYNPQRQFQHFHSEPFDCLKPEPVAIFECSPDENASQRSSIGTPTRCRRSKKRARSCDTYDGWSSSDSDEECTPCSVILISDPDPVDKAREVHDTPDVFNVETPNRIQSAHFQQDHSQNSGPSNEADNQEGASAATAVPVSAENRDSREAEGDPFHIETSPDRTECDREPGSTKRYSEAEPTQAAEVNHVSGILRSYHSFASQLMELTTQNGQTEMTTDAIMNLVSKRDRFSRRLRGSISQVKKEGKRE
ncbi:hypothetical protein ACEPAI_1577 [Sanghuangporus weigelae]